MNGAEARIVITGFFLLFCVLGGYFAVRPVRETIGTILGREATQNLWIFTALFALLIVPFYGWLVARVRRSVLLPAIYGFMSVAFVFTAQVFQGEPPDPMVARVFYVAISVMNLLLVSVFWSFMLEILSSEQAQAAVRLHRRRRHAGRTARSGRHGAVREEHRQLGRAVRRRRHVSAWPWSCSAC